MTRRNMSTTLKTFIVCFVFYLICHLYIPNR